MGRLSDDSQPAGTGTYQPIDSRSNAGTTWTAGQVVTSASGALVYRVDVTHTGAFDTSKATQLGGTLLADEVAARSALQPWWAALGNRDNAAALITVAGDSIVEGQGATSGTPVGADRAYRWTDVLSRRLNAKYPAASPITPPSDSDWLATAHAGAMPVAWTFNPVETSYASFGPGMLARDMSKGNGQTATVTFTGTGCDLFYGMKSTGGTFSVTIDGSVVTASVNGAAQSVDFDGTFISYRGLTAGSHTLVVTVLSGRPIIDGIRVYNGNESKGIAVINGGHYGDSAYARTNSGSATSLTTLWGWNRWINAAGTDLCIFALLANDTQVAGMTPAAYKANLLNMIAGVRTPNSSGALPNKQTSFVLLADYRRGSVDAATWASYVAVMREIQAADPLVCVCDLSARMPASNNGAVTAAQYLGLYSDEVHPTRKGHATMADLVMEFISPR